MGGYVIRLDLIKVVYNWRLMLVVTMEIGSDGGSASESRACSL